MKAITLQDDAPANPTPWLTLVEFGVKPIETRRNWVNRKHRGDTLLTGSATSRTPNKGVAACVVKVVDIVPMTETHEAKACIALFDGAWALMLEDLRWLSRKFPVKGALGVFDVPIPDDVTIYAPDPALLLPNAFPDYLKQFMAASSLPSVTEQEMAFLEEHFPADTRRALVKAGFLKPRSTPQQVRDRVCQYFGLASIFEYATIGEGTAVHLSLTRKGIEEGVQANFVIGQ